jgi:AbiJ N-terminal domain 4
MEVAFQREAMDKELRTALWNVLKVSIWDSYDIRNRKYDNCTKQIDQLVLGLWFHYFNYDLDSLPDFYGSYETNSVYETFKKYFFTCKWFEAYDFIEAIAEGQSDLFSIAAAALINGTLETHNAAYRLIGNSITEITSSEEIEAIETALKLPTSAVRIHLDLALRMLSGKEKPDYRNSVKESISAIEAACRSLTGNPTATLGEGLKRINNVHPAMVSAFQKLYGYSSDASGIRHSITDEATVTYADAKFMLVACSAFSSYLMGGQGTDE